MEPLKEVEYYKRISHFWKDTGKSNAVNIPDYNWYTEAFKNKKDVIELFGNSTNVNYDFVLDSATLPMPMNEIIDLVYQMQKIIPNYFIRYNIRAENFAKDKIEFFPQKNIGQVNPKAISVKPSKHLSIWLNTFSGKLENHTKYRCHTIMNKIQEIKNQYKVSELKVYTYISCDPMSFLSIGMTSVDSGSCYRQSSCNFHHKYFIAREPTSFILWVATSPIQFDEHGIIINKNIISRAWCLYNKEIPAIHLNNYYTPKGYPEGTGFIPIQKSFDILLKGKTKRYLNKHHVEGVYFNSPFRYTYSTKKIEETKYISVNTDNYRVAEKCSKCEELINRKKQKTCDGKCNMCERRFQNDEFVKVTKI